MFKKKKRKRSDSSFSYLKKCNYNGSQHDKNRVEYGPEDERDRQTPHLCELIDIWERPLIKETPVNIISASFQDNNQQCGKKRLNMQNVYIISGSHPDQTLQTMSVNLISVWKRSSFSFKLFSKATILQSAWLCISQCKWLHFWAVVGFVKLVGILSLTTWYLIPASCSTTMSIKHAIRPVRKPIKPHTTQRLISRQRKLWNTRQEKREEREGSYKGSHMLSIFMHFVLVNSPHYLPCNPSSSPLPETAGSQCCHSPDSGWIHKYEHQSIFRLELYSKNKSTSH